MDENGVAGELIQWEWGGGRYAVLLLASGHSLLPLHNFCCKILLLLLLLTCIAHVVYVRSHPPFLINYNSTLCLCRD